MKKISGSVLGSAGKRRFYDGPVEKERVKLMNPVVLAFVGDAVYTLCVRARLALAAFGFHTIISCDLRNKRRPRDPRGFPRILSPDGATHARAEPVARKDPSPLDGGGRGDLPPRKKREKADEEQKRFGGRIRAIKQDNFAENNRAKRLLFL